MLWAVVSRLGPSGEPRPGWPEDRAADRDAVGRLARGESDALTALYDRHARAIYSLALRIVEDQSEAEEVVQEVFSQAWIQASRYDAARGPVAAWLLTMARSRAIDRRRARRARPDAVQPVDERAMGDLPDPAAGQEVTVLTGEQVRRLREAMAALPVAQRIALELAYYEELTQSEIAARLDEPLGTVKTRIRLALLKLRDALADTGS